MGGDLQWFGRWSKVPLAVEFAIFAALLPTAAEAQSHRYAPLNVRPRLVIVAFGDDDKVTPSPAEQARMKEQSRANLRKIALAILVYQDAKGTLPAAFTGTADKPLLSWRVAILPYLEQKRLYDEFHLDEPWDSEHNLTLVAKMPDVLQAPTSAYEDGRTVYLTPRGEMTAFPGSTGTRLTGILDGTSNTIAVVEADDEVAVPWTQPEDWDFDGDNPHAGLGGQYTGGFHAALCDGSVHFILNKIDDRTLTGLFTRNGREPVRLPN